MNHSNLPLSAQEIALFRALVKPAPAYLLMLRMKRPISTREVARILSIPEQTAAGYMRTLQSLGLVAWDEHENRYKLNDGHQRILNESFGPIVQQEPEDQAEENAPELMQEAGNSPRGSASDRSAQVWQELFSAGVSRNSRTRALVRQSYITSEYVRAHRLKLIASGKSGPQWAGLLVTILEGGEPAPPLNPNGHLETCDCLDCHGYRVARSWEEPF
jgi:hypothetical protein